MQTKTKECGFTLIELIAVTGIIGIITAVLLNFMVTSRISFDSAQAQIQAKEYAKIAIAAIAKELRLSRPSKVRIANSLGWVTETSPGSVVNFQIPVGSFDAALNLTSNYEIRWGSNANENYYIAYLVDNNSRLRKSTYSLSTGSGAINSTIAPNISNLTVSRDSISSDLIHIQVTAQIPTHNGAINQTLTSDVKLRNS
jgi:prepilin-type N-terminal cleavage/methylation domain-containing protein